MLRPSIAIVTTATRLQGLLTRWGTKGAARFRLDQAVAHTLKAAPVPSKEAALQGDENDLAFAEYEREDSAYQSAIDQIRRDVDLGYPITLVPRQHVPNFDFVSVVVVIVVGPDGLVANVAKYAAGRPIIGINPDPQSIDGILVPFKTQQVRSVLQRVLRDGATIREVTLARAQMNDGQSMLAFNDLFIGRRSHASARYTIEASGSPESQSSSGVIVATGAGSTGWLSSVFNMTNGVNQWLGSSSFQVPAMRWEDRKLVWVVREPFRSKHSSVDSVAGEIDDQQTLTISSLMPEMGVVFSDGIENDFLEFNSGSTLKITVANERARLVVPNE